MATFSEDGRLILRVCVGDLEALGALYEKHKTPVFRVALAITDDKSLAEDILQETFLRLYSHASTIDPCFPLAPWLYRVAVNLSYTNVIRGRRWLVSLETLVDRLLGPSRTFPEEHAESREIQRAVWQAIDSLEPAHRVTVILYYLCNLSLREISYACECPVGTVKSRLHYGRTHLRQALSGLRLNLGRAAPEAR